MEYYFVYFFFFQYFIAFFSTIFFCLVIFFLIIHLRLSNLPRMLPLGYRRPINNN